MMRPSSLSDAPQSACESHGRIYLLRHGAVRSSEGGKRYIGWQDIALSNVGIGQADMWANYFAALTLKEIYCSDLVRCHETARIIGVRCSIEPRAIQELREVCLGAWEGQCFDTVQRLHPQAFQERGDHIADYRPPGGESFRDLQKRVWPVFETIVRRLSGQALIVSHAGVIRVLLCQILGIPLENLFCIGQSVGALNIIDVRKKGNRVQALNLQPLKNISASGCKKSVGSVSASS
jgi:broad specificity phosphatase PhoE